MPDTIDVQTRLCAVIGNPVAHSLSPCIHNAAFEAAGLNYVYLAFRVEGAGACLQGMRALEGFRGLSVTIPHKQAVMPHLDHIDSLATHIGSVNTITNEGGRLEGMSTDGPGILAAFSRAGVELDGARILITGAGGAVRAAAFTFAMQTKASAITLLARNPAKADALAQEVTHKTGISVSAGRLSEDIASAMATQDVLVQGTPVGMEPNSGESCVPKELLESRHIVFDMVYRPHWTRLLQDARVAGCTVVHGIEMLIGQAALQWERWTGQTCPVDAMRRAAMQALGEESQQ